MTNTSTTTLLPLLAATGLLFFSTDSNAVTPCSTDTQLGTFVRDDVVVRSGKCTIDGSTINGNINVVGGTLEVKNSTIRGSITGDGGVVQLSGNVSLYGALSIRNASDTSGFLGAGNQIRGDVMLANNAAYVLAHKASIRGDLTVESNTGGVNIAGNTINGDLYCANNNPRPTGFSNSVARGRDGGQCAAGPVIGKDDSASPARSR